MARSDLLRERMTRNGVATRECASVADAAAITCAIQAQDAPASRLGIRARAGGVTDSDVLRAIADERTVVRTWLMRATIHLVATADVRWLVRLIGPTIERRHRKRWRDLGLTDALLERIVAVLPAVLADGPMTRAEIRDALPAHGVGLESPDPQAHTHALVYASTLGLVCRGPERGRDATFTLLDSWVPSAPAGPDGDAALAALARRYFAAFSPATAVDFTTWSGLPGGQAVELIRDELAPCDVDGRPGWRLGEVEPQRGLRLLPQFDNYLLGYRDREAILRAEFRARIYQGGLIHAAVVRDGAVLGRWRLQRSSGELTVTPFVPFSRPVWRAVEGEVADIARFLGTDVTLVRE